MKRSLLRNDLPEQLQYSKYYEHDGLLRAYANRAMVMAFLFAGIAAISLGFAIYVRIQPPTIIRVAPDGTSFSLNKTTTSATGTQSTDNSSPTELEAKAMVRNFLEH